MGYIYRYIDNNEIIYVGKTKRELSQRILEHEQERKFMPYLATCKIQYFETATNVEMDIAEKYYINLYLPKLNVVDMEHATFDFVMPERHWLDYNSELYKIERKSTDLVPKSQRDIKLDELHKLLSEKEQESESWDNFRDWLDFIFDGWVNNTLDIRSNKVIYDWDLTSYPLPDYVVLNGQNNGLWSRSELQSNGDYRNVIDLSVLQDFLKYGQDAYKSMSIKLRSDIIDLETQIECM